MTVGKRIQQAREILQISQDELANRIGINRVNLSRIERGMVNVRFDTVLGIAKALGIKMSELVEGVD